MVVKDTVYARGFYPFKVIGLGQKHLKMQKKQATTSPTTCFYFPQSLRNSGEGNFVGVVFDV